MIMPQEHYLDFSYNGHWASEYNLIRVSDGSRYNNNLIPTLTDKTAEIPGADGMYLFNTYYKQRQFTINFVFDSVTETNLRDIRTWLNGKSVGPLIFAEQQDRQYYAKVTGAPSMKFIPFDERPNKGSPSNTNHAINPSGNSQVIYKGEGTVQFTCYDPYAYSTTQQSISGDVTSSPQSASFYKLIGGEYNTPFTYKWSTGGSSLSVEDHYIQYERSLSVWVSSSNNPNTWKEINKITFPAKTLPESVKNSGSYIEWNSSTGLVTSYINGTIRPVKYIGNSMGLLPVGKYVRITNLVDNDGTISAEGAIPGGQHLYYYERFL